MYTGVEWAGGVYFGVVCIVVGVLGSQHVFWLFQPQPEPHCGGGGLGWWGTQQALPECQSQFDGQSEPLGGLGGFGLPP